MEKTKPTIKEKKHNNCNFVKSPLEPILCALQRMPHARASTSICGIIPPLLLATMGGQDAEGLQVLGLLPTIPNSDEEMDEHRQDPLSKEVLLPTAPADGTSGASNVQAPIPD
eukprot:467522-Amphidinium_carterae.1